MRDLGLFEPVGLPRELAGLSAGMLASLYDLVLNFGVDVPGAAIRRLCAKPGAGRDLRISKEIYVSVVVPPATNRNIMISRWPGSISTDLSFLFFLDDGRRSPVYWDRSFTVDDLVRFIAAVDDEMRPLGAVDPSTGRRSRLVSQAYTGWKLSVDAVFAERGHVVEATDMSAEALRDQFDRPEELAVFADDGGRRLLCRAADLAYVRTRGAVMARVLADRGITDLAELRRLPPEERAALLAAVNAAMRSMDN